MFELRRNLPTAVTRLSPLVACFDSESLFIFMLRNLKQVKALLLIPVRFCLKKTGPLELSFTRIQMIGKSQLITNTMTIEEKNTSNTLLKKRAFKSSNGIS